jgi:CDP-paratose 2-epimerase
MSRRILVTGGAGFVGANVALGVAARRPDWSVTALDNLRRRGSELNLARLRKVDVGFVHGDVRVLDDVLGSGGYDAIVECSAEPSVLSGGDYVVQANLVGAYHCLELARRCDAQLVFLSSSRVYPVAALARLDYAESESRFELLAGQELVGAGAAGVSERFPLEGARTLYGATKLAAELLIEEYVASFGLRAVVDRCGVIAGPWQMGKVDQGVFAHWMLAHHFGRPLRYIGYGGTGKQVRDLLHVEDLVELIARQLDDPEHWSGITVNVGGGRDCSLSLAETTVLCRQISGREVPIGADPASRPGDVPIYLSDCTRLFALTDWRPRRGPREILADMHAWIVDHEAAIHAAL